jgi:glycosidase
MEFHVSRKARDRYQFDESLFSLSGNVIFTNFRAARLFTQKINAKRDLVSFPEQAVRAGQLNAMGLIDEILHMVVNLYSQQKNPIIMTDALDWLYGMLGKETVDGTLRRFAEEFPPLAVYRREISLDEYMKGAVELTPWVEKSNREVVLEEMLLLWLGNVNPAFAPYIELFDDSSLKKDTSYVQIMAALHSFFETQPPFGPENQNLMDMLRAPALAAPYSLPGQLEYMRQRWGFLPSQFLYRLLSSQDLIREEEKPIFGGGAGPSHVVNFTGMETEPERFSQDKDWMPSLVLIAKNAFVWLDQLSKKYHHPITTLDLIPDEELDALAGWGFTGLWLIGLWERSAASKRIKQLRGNPDAVASAYSLFDYQIAADLGGEAAYQNLHDRAWQRGIRLASDMVPNHMGIDSRWLIEHPDWFISQDYSPFPSYSFSGPDLSWDNRVGIYLEDHYYNNSDASVVFKREDKWTGSTKYVYHGNDGTSMPWNDTAQLDYLKAEVREAVIQTILSVARKFPIIRFDAAMTLAKKHVQRLWFPEPGAGGAIPSRAEHALTKEQFDALMPVEFWREVVDRVAQETPDTLLLAEAFWLMEGYFVRTLGMHRVYNSAFMNMLRDEKNVEYRLVIKNTLEFDPEILKRYVNFMNNPDERTAIDQFGKDDKYFGICTLLATLPGLPMFGHGQVEGFTEKYGMEYRRAYLDEYVDRYLVERHEREIFPLLRRRYLFAEVKDFLLYDFRAPEGFVNEDVFAFSNRAGDMRSLVVYHNKYAAAKGWIQKSAPYSVKAGSEGERSLVQKNLGEGLDLDNDANTYVIFRDQLTDLEYIRNNREIYKKGLYVELGAYQRHVFMDFHQVADNDWRQYAQLTEYLNGLAVPDIAAALKEILLQPVHYPFRELVNAGMFRWIMDNRVTAPTFEEHNFRAVLDEAQSKSMRLMQEIKLLIKGHTDETSLAVEIRRKLEAAMQLPALAARFPHTNSPEFAATLKYLYSQKEDDPLFWGILLGWLFTHNLGKLAEGVYPDSPAEISRSWLDEWLFNKIIAGVLKEVGVEAAEIERAVALIKILVMYSVYSLPAPAKEQTGVKVTSQTRLLLETWLQDRDVQRFIGVNRYQGVLWYNKESFEHLLVWVFTLSVVDACADAALSPEDVVKTILKRYDLVRRIQQAEEASAFQVEKLLNSAI